VARLIAHGLTNAEIANALIISQATAKRHVENMLAKLDLRSRLEVADWVAKREA
jgi:DNA-binding NarL/FixJ family response regulator